MTTTTTLHHSCLGSSRGTCRHLLPKQSPVRTAGRARHAAPCSARNTGRQVTNLNGARIFRIVQQSDGAAVFPFKIPDAATHKSAQHLPGESPAPRLRTRTMSSNTSVPLNVTLTTIPGPLHDQQPRIQAPRRAPLLSR